MEIPEAIHKIHGDLRQAYYTAEKEIEWPKGTTGFTYSNDYCDIIIKLRAKIKERSLEEGLSPEAYQNRLYGMLGFIERLRNAINPPREGDKHRDWRPIWIHQDIDRLVGWNEEKSWPDVERGDLLIVVAGYLAEPWLQFDQIDFILIDCLIFIELLVYSKSIYSGNAYGQINWAYKLAKQNPGKATLIRAFMGMGGFAARYIIPVGALFLIYWFFSEETTIIAGSIYLAYIAFYLLRWPIRRKRKKELQKNVEEHIERLRRMMEAYFYCKPPVINLSTLLKYIERASESRPVFEGALFSLLNRVRSQKGDTFTPYFSTETND